MMDLVCAAGGGLALACACAGNSKTWGLTKRWGCHHGDLCLASPPVGCQCCMFGKIESCWGWDDTCLLALHVGGAWWGERAGLEWLLYCFCSIKQEACKLPFFTVGGRGQELFWGFTQLLTMPGHA